MGIYAGMGCMDYSAALTKVAELLQAPVATSVSGKGVIDECHPLAVGWGYGPQATRTAENAFQAVDVVLAIGVRYSEVSTGCYSIPPHRCLIHVDANPNNLGRIVKPAVCVNADAGVFPRPRAGRRRRRGPAARRRPGRPHPRLEMRGSQGALPPLRPLRGRPDAVPAGAAQGDLPRRA